MALEDLKEELDAKIVNVEQQIEALQGEIEKKTDEQNDYKKMMDDCDIDLRRYSTDATSDMTSLITYTYILSSADSTGAYEIIDGFPIGYDSTSIGGMCYDSTSTDIYFYAFGDQENIFPLSTMQAYQIDTTSDLSFIFINCKELWYNELGIPYTVIKCSEVVETFSTDKKYFHKWYGAYTPTGEYYPGNIDATSDMTSWVVFDYILSNHDSTGNNEIISGAPGGYDTSGSTGTCWVEGSIYFHTLGDKTSTITPGQYAFQNGDNSSICYINILCVEYWSNTPPGGPYYTVARFEVQTGQRGQTTTSYDNPISLLKEDFYYNGGNNWNSLPADKKNKMLKIPADFWYAHDYIFLPIGMTGTYGTKDNIAKMQLGIQIQEQNKAKLEAGAVVFEDYV